MSMELRHVGMDQKIPQQGKLERFFHQKSQQICKPLLLHSREELPGPRRALLKAPLSTMPMIIPRMLKGILFPHHGIPNHTHTKEVFCASSGSKQVYKRKTKHLTNGVKYPRKKRLLCGKNLVWEAQLIRHNILLLRFVHCQERHHVKL